MKLPKLELKFRRWNAPEQKSHIVRQIQKGKTKYILQHGLLYVAIYIGVRILLDLFTGKVFTVIPGFPAHIILNGEILIRMAVWAFFALLTGYWFANRLWKKTEASYQRLLAEEQTLTEAEPIDAEMLRKTPVYLRNIK